MDEVVRQVTCSGALVDFVVGGRCRRLFTAHALCFGAGPGQVIVVVAVIIVIIIIIIITLSITSVAKKPGARSDTTYIFALIALPVATNTGDVNATSAKTSLNKRNKRERERETVSE